MKNDLRDNAHRLAILVLQGNLYQENMEIRDAVRDILAITTNEINVYNCTVHNCETGKERCPKSGC